MGPTHVTHGLPAPTSRRRAPTPAHLPRPCRLHLALRRSYIQLERPTDLLADLKDQIVPGGPEPDGTEAEAEAQAFMRKLRQYSWNFVNDTLRPPRLRFCSCTGRGDVCACRLVVLAVK